MKQTILFLFTTILAMGLFIQCDSSLDSGSGTEPPEEPDLISPSHESDRQSTHPELRWSRVDEADRYQVMISTSENFESAVVDTLVSSRSFKVETLDHETSYFWRVRAHRDNQTGRWSSAWHFTTAGEDHEPVTVTLESPEDATEFEAGDVQFEWESLAEAEEYHYQLTLNEEFEEILLDTLVSMPSLDIQVEHVEGEYFWRVAPVMDAAPTEWSSVRSFYTLGDSDGQSPSAVSLEYPTHRSSDIPVELEFEWEEIWSVELYQFQLATEDDFNETVKDEEVEGNTHAVQDLVHDTRYYWRVRAIDGQETGEWSRTHRFDTKTELPSSEPIDPNAFVQVENTDFVVNGEPFRFVGTNAYYLPNYQKIDASVVRRAFDAFEEAGVTTIRMWAFYDGYDCGYSQHDSSENVIQTAPGEYSESALRDLDQVIAEGKERGMRFILPLVNYWDELGGICQYNTWAGASNPGRNMSFFINNEDTQRWFRDYIEMLLNRVNTETGVAYKDDPAIMAWQIINEGRNSGADPEILRDWYQEIAQFIKSIDSNHLLGTGEEGFDEGTPSEYSSEEYSNTYVLRAQEGSSYIMNTAIPEIDFASAHWYPQDWGFGWEPSSDMFRAQRAWLDDHQRIAEQEGKPFILGEYGYVGWGDSRTLQVYEELWEHAESIELDGSLLWQLTADYVKCTEFGGNICWPDGREDRDLFMSFRDHLRQIQGN